MPKIAPTSPLYAQFRQDFPAQAGQGIPGDLNYSDTIVPIVDMTAAAGEGQLAQNLQTAWDFSTGNQNWSNGGFGTLINNPGFWLIDVNCGFEATASVDNAVSTLSLSDGLTAKLIWSVQIKTGASFNDNGVVTTENQFVVYLRSGDSVTYAASSAQNSRSVAWYRQIADINGNPTNPLGFTFN